MIRSDIASRVKNYLDNRTDLDDMIDAWINDTRNHIALQYNFNYLYVESTTSTEAGSARYSLPSDYLGHLNLFLGDKKLARIMPGEFDSLIGNDVDITATDAASPQLFTTSGLSQGEPDYYVDRGMEFELYPVPDAAYTLLLKYYASPELWTIGLAGDTEYDYISTFHFDAVIWGASLRGALFLDDSAKENKFEKRYVQEITKMIQREKDRFATDNFVRMKTTTDFNANTLKRIVKMRN